MFRKSVYVKRFAVVLGIFACLAPVFAQGVEFSFSNELSSDIVNITNDGKVEAAFAGIEDEVVIEMTSERVDLGIEAVFGFYYDPDRPSDYRSWLGYSAEDFDWYAAFRPIRFLEFGLSKDYELAGSYMFVEDDNVAGSKMGSDGLSIAFLGGGVMPVLDGLTVAFTMPFNYLGAIGDEEMDGNLELYGANFFKHFQFGFGAEYAFGDLFTVGAAVRSYHDHDAYFEYGDREWAFSAAAAVFPIEGLSIYVGYGYNDYEGLMDVYGDHLINASVSYEADRFAVGADFLTNLGKASIEDHPDYDLYAALYGEFSVTDPLLVFLTVAEQNTLGHDAFDWTISAAPGVEFDTGRFGAISFEVEVGFTGNDGKLGFDYVCFPLTWTYEF